MNSPVPDSRQSRGADIARVESNVRRLGKDEYRVRSQHGSDEYKVLLTEAGWVCSCPDFRYRQVKCKHVFVVMDDETRFRIAQQVSDKKGVSDVRPLFREARERTHKAPKTFITDGAQNFHVAFMRELNPFKGTARASAHVRGIRLEGTVHNNKMERMNGEV